MKSIVVSRTLRPQDHPAITIVADRVEEALARLRAEPGKDIWLFGGGALFRTLLDARLVDTVEVAVVPVLLGGGIPLLPPPAERARLRLVGSRAYKTGNMSLEYAVERSDPPTKRQPKFLGSEIQPTSRPPLSHPPEHDTLDPATAMIDIDSMPEDIVARVVCSSSRSTSSTARSWGASDPFVRLLVHGPSSQTAESPGPSTQSTTYDRWTTGEPTCRHGAESTKGHLSDFRGYNSSSRARLPLPEKTQPLLNRRRSWHRPAPTESEERSRCRANGEKFSGDRYVSRPWRVDPC